MGRNGQDMDLACQRQMPSSVVRVCQHLRANFSSLLECIRRHMRSFALQLFLGVRGVSAWSATEIDREHIAKNL